MVIRNRREKRKTPRRVMLLFVIIMVVATVTGYHYRDHLFAYAENEPRPDPGETDLPPPGEDIEKEEPGDPVDGEFDEEPKPSPYPPPEGEILHIADGDYLLALVTKQTTLGEYTPADLVRVPDEMKGHDYPYELRAEAYQSLRTMWETARAEGITLSIVSAYRSYETQRIIFNDNVARRGGDEEEANRFSARPGQSEHQLGTVVDFTAPGAYLSAAFAETPAGLWLAENAHRFGFVMSYPADSQPITGYIYEPWHFRYIGVDNALAWKESGLVLSQFLEDQPQDWKE